MNDEIYIDKVIFSLKKKLDQNNKMYRSNYKGEVFLSEVKFNKPLSEEKISKTKGINLPRDYISFLKISNGAEFFIDDYHGSRALLELYSLDEIIELKKAYANGLGCDNEYPIGSLLDNCEITIDEIALKNKENYLMLSDGTKRFNYSFQEWLDKFIIAQGNEFWLLDSPYE